MRAGRMNRQITVQRKQTGQEAVYGTQTVTWVPLVYLPGSPAVAERFDAEVMDVMPSRNESVSQGLAVAKNMTRIRLRWRSDIDSSMRVVVHGDSDVTYQIVGGPAEVFGRKDTIEIMCERYSS